MISMILPTYNPGPTLTQTWFAVEKFLLHQADPWEAIFVLDGCTDGTPELLAKLATTSDPRMRIVSYSQNRGKGHALRIGLLAAEGDYRVFTDVDLAYSFDDVLRVAEALRSGADVVIASREHPASRVLLPSGLLGHACYRQFQSRVFRAITRMLLPLTQRDTQAGLKGMTATVAERVVPNLRCDGFGFDCELLTACVRSGIAVAEIPVCVRYESSASTTGVRAMLRMLWELWRIRRAWRSRPGAVPVTASCPVSSTTSTTRDCFDPDPPLPLALGSRRTSEAPGDRTVAPARRKRSKVKRAK